VDRPDPSPQPPPTPPAPLLLQLWPGDIAPSVTMRVVFPERAAGDDHPTPCLVVFRGGGYVTNQGSGGGSAEWAAAHGMVGVEVAYRTQATGDAFPKPYADAARAVRLVRARANEWNVDPTRVAVLGYSAGGHLASLLSTQPRLHVEPGDDLATVDARPNLVLLGYPVISFIEQYVPGAFARSAGSFFGRPEHELDEPTRRAFSNELHVTPDHPPVFVWTTADDELVPAAHSACFAAACERAGVPVRLRVYPHGPHGLGLAVGRGDDVAGWPEEALGWLRERGYVGAGR
jgi:acetyl esterase/lipase